MAGQTILDADPATSDTGRKVPTCVPSIDQLLRGGVPFGSVVEISGWRTPHPAQVTRLLLIRARAANERCALIDSRGGESGWHRGRFKLGDYVQPSTSSPSVAMAHAAEIVAAGIHGAVFVDLGLVAEPAGSLAHPSTVRELAAAALENDVLCVVLTERAEPWRQHSTERDWIAQRIHFQRGTSDFVMARVERFGAARYAYLVPTAGGWIDRHRDLIQCGLVLGVLEQRGSRIWMLPAEDSTCWTELGADRKEATLAIQFDVFLRGRLQELVYARIGA